MNAVPPPESGTPRPRVEGDREAELLDATLDVLADVGYDKLTMDAVAARAKASKATLYRRWSSKASLVVDAMAQEKGTPEMPDTGSLRGDLLAAYCGLGGHRGIMEPRSIAVFTSVLTAIQRDEEFAAEFRQKFIGPKIASTRIVYDRAKARGEVREDLDPALFGPALPGICLHRFYALGEPPTPELVERIVDQIIIPAATAGAPDETSAR